MACQGDSIYAATAGLLSSPNRPHLLYLDLRFLSERPPHVQDHQLESLVRSVALSQDCTVALATCADGRTRVDYPMEQSKTGFSFHAHRDTVVHCCAFTPSGAFATGAANGEVCFWDEAKRSRIAHAPKNPGPISSLAIDPTGERLALAISRVMDEERGVTEEIRVLQMNPNWCARQGRPGRRNHRRR